MYWFFLWYIIMSIGETGVGVVKQLGVLSVVGMTYFNVLGKINRRSEEEND